MSISRVQQVQAREVGLGELNGAIEKEFSSRVRIAERLGYDGLTPFLRDVDSVAVEGQYPELIVKLREKPAIGRLSKTKPDTGKQKAPEEKVEREHVGIRSVPPANGVAETRGRKQGVKKHFSFEEVQAHIVRLVTSKQRSGLRCDIPTIGENLCNAFSRMPRTHQVLKFPSLTSLIRAIDGLVICENYGVRFENLETTSKIEKRNGDQTRKKVADFESISNEIIQMVKNSENGEMTANLIGSRLSSRLGKGFYKDMGYTSFLNMIDEIPNLERRQSNRNGTHIIKEAG